MTEKKLRLAYSIKETAELIGVSRSTIYQMVKVGVIDCREIRGRKVIPTPEIDRLLGFNTSEYLEQK